MVTSWLVGLVSLVAKIHLFDGEVPDDLDQTKRISTKLWLYISTSMEDLDDLWL